MQHMLAERFGQHDTMTQGGLRVVHLQVYRVLQSRHCIPLLCSTDRTGWGPGARGAGLVSGLTSRRTTHGGVCRRSGHIPVSRDADPSYLAASSRLVDWALIIRGLDGDLRDVGAQALALGRQVLGAHRSMSSRPSNTCGRPCLDALGDNTWDLRE